MYSLVEPYQYVCNLDARIAPARLTTFNIGEKGLDDSYQGNGRVYSCQRQQGSNFSGLLLGRMRVL